MIQGEAVMSKKIEGVLTAIVTPFDEEGALHLESLKQQVDRQLSAGNGIFCGGTNGEFFVLNEQEKIAVTDTCVKQVNGRASVVAHIGEISTRETIRLGKQIEKLGVDAVSVITPYFVPLKQNELITHYTAVADALSVPVFLYNIPARTGNTLEPQTVRTLASHPNIIGIKDSAGSYESLSGYLNAVKDIENFDVLNGPDSLIHKGFVDGCSACISGLANVAPKEINTIWARFKAGDIEGSRQAQENVTGLRTDLYSVGFSPAAVKKALQIMGYDVGASRYAVSFSEEQQQQIRQIVTQYLH
jgi:4-hydroxy-tetrahydrodipicolinate synthase